MVEITSALGITKDQLIRLRNVLRLPLRLDRAARARPEPMRDPTPAEIAERAAAIRAGWDARTEEARRVCKASPVEAMVISSERFSADNAKPASDRMERLADDAMDR